MIEIEMLPIIKESNKNLFIQQIVDEIRQHG
jgi:hypothetical protein